MLRQENVKLEQITMPDGTALWAEVTELAPTSGRVPAGRLGDAAGHARQTMAEGLDNLKKSAAYLLSTLRDMEERPSEASVEFGIKVSSEVGVVLASGSVEANYKVTLTWKSGDH